MWKCQLEIKKFLDLKPKKMDHVFIYQTSKSDETLLKILNKIDCKFIVYGFNVDKVVKNVTFRIFNDKHYYTDFAHAKAVIVNGGLTTITEAIYLKKPVLAIPIRGQFEQVFNAKTIEDLGLGLYIKRTSEEGINKFLNNLDNYSKNLSKYSGMNNERILKKIDKEILAEIKKSN